MGVCYQIDDQLELPAQDAAAQGKEGNDGTQTLAGFHVSTMETTKALTPVILDSYRRDVFASYPPMAVIPTMESIDECKWESSCCHGHVLGLQSID